MKFNKNICIITGVFLFFINSISAQIRSIKPEKIRYDEYIGIISIDDDLDIYLKGPCDYCPGEDIADFSFSWSNSFDTAINNEILLKRAREKAKRDWFNKQKNLIKENIERKFGDKFANYNEAKDALFLSSESGNIYRNSKPPINKYGSLRGNGYNISKGYLKELKLLQLRKIEIGTGNINNSKYGYLKANGILLKDIKDINTLNQKWNNIVIPLGSNINKSHYNNSIYQKLNNLGTGFNEEIIALKNNYYNSFDEWKQLNLMQILLNFEEYKRLSSCGVCLLPSSFYQFKDVDKATSPVIEDYAIKNRSVSLSVFDPYYDYRAVYDRWRAREGRQEAIYQANKWKVARQNAINNLVNDVNADNFAITNLIAELDITDNIQKSWLLSNRNEAEKAIDFLNANKTNGLPTTEAKNFIKQAIALDVTLDNQLQVKQTGLIPSELQTCCPDYGDYDNDLIIQEYGIQPVQQAVDGTFNIFISTASLIGSEEWVGRNVRRIMTEIGMSVPADVTNEHLAALFKIRKRNGIVIVEYREGILATMLDFGLNSIDMIAFLTPSKGGGAFLASKIGGITITKITQHLRNIAVNNKKVDDLVSALNPKAKFDLNGTGQNSVVKGHHPLAKSAFRSDKFYDLKKAFSVSANSLGGQAVHNAITGNQNRLYSAFAKKGEVLTLDKMADIEIQAMFDAGIPKDIATGWVIKALQDLKAQGVKIITHIPWNGIN
jgi:hypothetical protein